MFTQLRLAAFKASVVLIPSYFMAWLTESMVWVIPMLAASSFFAATIGSGTTTRNLDEDDGDGQDEEEDDTDHHEAGSVDA